MAEGREQGREEGRVQKRLELARNMLAEFDVATVCQITGLSPEVVERLVTDR